MKVGIRTGLAAVVFCCVLSACGKRDTSPVIACELNDNIVPTPFTFNSFRKVLEKEHGLVDVEPNARLTSRSVEVRFTALADGRLLAERVVAKPSGEKMAPAVFFGVTNAVIRTGTATRKAD